MMNSYRRTNTGSRRRLAVITILAVIIVLTDIISGGTLRTIIQQTAGYISGTGIRTFDTIKHSGLLETRTALAEKNRALEAQVARYQDQAAAYKVLQDTNTHLAAMAHLAQDNTGQTVPIVSSSRSSPYGTFLIGAGSEEGIETDALVLTDLGFVIGHIADVSTHTALVVEILAPGKKTEAIVAGSATHFIGQGGANAWAQVPRGVAVTVGDTVTSGTVGGRPIGVVGKVDSDPADAYSTVLMRIPQNTSSLRYVFVLSKTP